MTVEQLKIVIAEPSLIIRSGIVVALKRLPGYRIQPVEVHSLDMLKNYLAHHKTDILIVNPVYWGNIDLQKLKEETNNADTKCVAFVNSMIDTHILRSFDETINVFDSVENLKEKFDKLLDPESGNAGEDTNTLSAREKEIIVCVVKGFTNKEIANSLFLSTHTVISHRRNIARKLEIHSSAGLTIYAIMNKLVELDEISKKTAM
jgi:Response regulator containing a CheY-like receiver domain and an HTH DNA-binding domain